METQKSEASENIRPWGRYDIVDKGQGFQVKRVTVAPGKQCSYQSHKRRNEIWSLVSGLAAVTLNDVRTEKNRGDTVIVPARSKHRIENIGTEPVVFIEVQLGDYLGEDDVERFADDFGRQLGNLSH